MDEWTNHESSNSWMAKMIQEKEEVNSKKLSICQCKDDHIKMKQ